MKYRVNTIKAQETFSADKTEVINIDQADPISELMIAAQFYQSAAGSMTLHPVACITKIELVDGSTPLVSLTGLQAEALDWYSHKNFRPGNWNAALAGNYLVRYIGINFGRWLWDEKYAFDPKKFTNPQLKVTMDINGGGLTGTYVKLQVIANSFDAKQVSPVGFLSARDVADKALGASSHIYYDLPTDETIRRLLIRAQTVGTEPNQLITNFKLGENGYKTIPFDISTEDLTAMLLAKYGRVKEEYLFVPTTSNRYLMIAPSSKVMATGNPWGTTAATNDITLYDGDGGRLKTILTTACNAQIKVDGCHPHCMWCIPFGQEDKDDDWYDMDRITKLQLDVTCASGAASTDTGEVMVETVHKY